MAKFELIEGGQPKKTFDHASRGDDFVGDVAPLTPEQIYKLQRTGRDTEELDIYQAELTQKKAELDQTRKETLHLIQGGSA